MTSAMPFFSSPAAASPAFDVIMPNGIQRKGEESSPRSPISGSRDTAPSCRTTSSPRPMIRCRRVRPCRAQLVRRSMIAEEGQAPGHQAPSCAATSPAAAGRNTKNRRPSAASSSPPASPNPPSCPEPILPPPRKATKPAAIRTYPSRKRGRSSVPTTAKQSPRPRAPEDL